jgi:hypothetical protein
MGNVLRRMIVKLRLSRPSAAAVNHIILETGPFPVMQALEALPLFR